MEYIEKKRKEGPLHFSLIDPSCENNDISSFIEYAKKAEKYDSDAILIGGSFNSHLSSELDKIISQIKEHISVPVILFPGSHSGISRHADAIFFMSLLNSRSLTYLIEEQVKGAPIIKNYGIETLPMGYLVIDSGSVTSVAWAGDVKPLPREKPEFAVAYSLAASYFGMRFVYLEAGSGAKRCVPNPMVAAVKRAIKDNGTLLIVGGGIRDEKAALEKIEAGADILVTGTIGEKNLEKMRKIIKAVKG